MERITGRFARRHEVIVRPHTGPSSKNEAPFGAQGKSGALRAGIFGLNDGLAGDDMVTVRGVNRRCGTHPTQRFFDVFVDLAVNGAYQATVTPGARTAPGAHLLLRRSLAAQLLRVDRVQQLVLLRTQLGYAQSLCAALDSTRLPEVIGTLAGEDTILVITADARRAKALVKRLEDLASGERIAS